ncbi:hypothetical protein ml_172 [Mollivirus sibericum]|uniref:hypothetical protein n=1 Tax=Mollivirus sibericum TaxID=1678078 RepID=UPI0006B2E300|nr:hypothetical protein ml_172 [Mollivirus sibericum]ALD61974.1 hypothetical protein ml_172 [Mollivirus sibericum]
MAELVEEPAGGLFVGMSLCFVPYYGLYLCSDSHSDAMVIMVEMRPREHEVVARVLKRIARMLFDSPEVPRAVLALGVDTSFERLAEGDPEPGTIDVRMGHDINSCAMYFAILRDDFVSRLMQRDIGAEAMQALLKEFVADGSSSPTADSLTYNFLLLRTLHRQDGSLPSHRRPLLAEAVSLLEDVCDLIDDVEALATDIGHPKCLGRGKRLSIFGVNLPKAFGLFLIYQFAVRHISAKFFRDKVDRPSRRYWDTLLGPIYSEPAPNVDEPRALLDMVCAYYLMWHTMETRTQIRIENLHEGSFSFDEPTSPAPLTRRHLLCGGRLALATFDTFDSERSDETALDHLRRLRADLSGDSWNYLATHFDFTHEDNESRAQQTESLVRALKILKRDHPKSQ